MKVLVRNVETGAYLVDASTWTSRVSDAMVFDSISGAIEYCREMENVCAVLKDDGGEADIFLPIGRRMTKRGKPPEIT
jgi:hypothetical protein